MCIMHIVIYIYSYLHIYTYICSYIHITTRLYNTQTDIYSQKIQIIAIIIIPSRLPSPFAATALLGSVFTLTVISVGRFVAVMFPFLARTSPDRALKVIAGVWIVSASIASPILVYRNTYNIQVSRDWLVVWYRFFFFKDRGVGVLVVFYYLIDFSWYPFSFLSLSFFSFSWYQFICFHSQLALSLHFDNSLL